MSKNIEIKTRDGKISIIHKGFNYDIDVDNLTDIHYENIEGEILGIATDLNQVGMLRAEAERVAKIAKFSLDTHSAQFCRDCRREAAINSNHFTVGGDRIKLTEGSLKEALSLGKEYQKLKVATIEHDAAFEVMDSIYWAVKEKATKLNKLSFKDEHSRS